MVGISTTEGLRTTIHKKNRWGETKVERSGRSIEEKFKKCKVGVRYRCSEYRQPSTTTVNVVSAGTTLYKYKEEVK